MSYPISSDLLFSIAPFSEIGQQMLGEHTVENFLRDAMPMLLHAVVPRVAVIVGIVNVIVNGVGFGISGGPLSFGHPLSTAFSCEADIRLLDEEFLESRKVPLVGIE